MPPKAKTVVAGVATMLVMAVAMFLFLRATNAHRKAVAQGETIIFERELTYVTSGLWFWVLDFLLMRRRMNRESRIALERLKERLERPSLRDINR